MHIFYKGVSRPRACLTNIRNVSFTLAAVSSLTLTSAHSAALSVVTVQVDDVIAAKGARVADIESMDRDRNRLLVLARIRRGSEY